MLTLLLTTAAVAGSWTFTESVDPFSDARITEASVRSTSVSGPIDSFDITLRCVAGGRMAFAFEADDTLYARKVNRNGQVPVEIRIGDEPPMTHLFHVANSGTQMRAAYGRRYTKAILRAMHGDQARVAFRITLDDDVAVAANFDLEGPTDGLERLDARCPVNDHIESPRTRPFWGWPNLSSAGCTFRVYIDMDGKAEAITSDCLPAMDREKLNRVRWPILDVDGARVPSYVEHTL